MENIVTAPKTDMFRFRINPEVRRQVENIYARSGLTFTQAINIFIQQSINAGGFPFPVSESNGEFLEIIRILDGRTDYLSRLFD